MQTNELRSKLTELKLTGMAEGLDAQLSTAHAVDLSFEERFGLLVDYELTYRENRRLKTLLKMARLKMQANIADINYSAKPTDNAFCESFNGTFRSECLGTSWFQSLSEARQRIEAWRQANNVSRRRGALADRAPAEFASQIAIHRDLAETKASRELNPWPKTNVLLGSAIPRLITMQPRLIHNLTNSFCRSSG